MYLMTLKRNFLLLSLIAILFLSCAQQKIKSNATLEERMEFGTKLFEKGKYFDAKTQFRIITLSHSGNLIAAEAQYYLGECHFHMKEYIIAASEYERLNKVYPGSEWVDDAKYKLGLSYYKLSPKYALDQEYTLKAIMEFQEFLEDYPSSTLTDEVEKDLKIARDKLAEKIYESAEIYRKMAYYSAANIYYAKVLDEYYDTTFAPQALYWIGECNRKLHKYSIAIETFDEFAKKYPKHEWQSRVKNKVKQTRQDYAKMQRAEAKAEKAKNAGSALN
jgi:outer membrane protein assembly factor BamD